MKITILGGGKVGETMCRELSLDNHDIYLIEQNESKLEAILESLDITGILGNGASIEIQQEIGMNEMDVFCAVTENDELNMIASVLAKQLGAHNTIARVRNPDYANFRELMSQSLNIDMFINPELEAARACVNLIQFPLSDSIETFQGNIAPIVSMKVMPSFKYNGYTLTQFRELCKNVIVCASIDQGQITIPDGTFVLKPSQQLFITGPINELVNLYKENGQTNDKISSLLIVGGNKITHYILRLLKGYKGRIKVMEINQHRAHQLSQLFPKVEVILGDGSHLPTLKEEGAQHYDALFALTGIDEENIIISMMAKTLGIKKRVTKINRTELIEVIEPIDLQSIITPKRLIADKIVQYVRALNNSLGSNVEALYTIANDEIEALQFKICANSKVTQHNLQNLKLKPNILIAYILREQQVIFPTGEDYLQTDDRVIVISHHHHLSDIDEILL